MVVGLLTARRRPAGSVFEASRRSGSGDFGLAAGRRPGVVGTAKPPGGRPASMYQLTWDYLRNTK